MYQNVFNEIAPSWYNLRHHSIMTSELKSLAQRWKEGSLLNLGCAHGADFVPFKDNFQLTGVDIAPQMADYLQKYSHKFGFKAKFMCADMESLPFPDQSFDWVLAIACLHHLESVSGRSKALSEMRRVLKINGEAFITVWNKSQPRFADKCQEQIIPYEVKASNGYKKVLRYYYLYEYDEIRLLAEDAGFTVLTIHPESGHAREASLSRNICLLLKKKECEEK